MNTYKFTAAVAALAAATLAGCSTGPDPQTGAAPSSSTAEWSEGQSGAETGYGGGTPVADIGRVAGSCQQFISFGGGTWVVPGAGVGPLVWAPGARGDSCKLMPGQEPVVVTPAAGAPGRVPVADYVIVGGRCTVTVTIRDTVWAMPESGWGALTRATEPVTGACRKAN
ncbi:Uncharacterised protein [Mycobacteroides abscessus subsp. abscessus]|uniref:hypothetical protein n=1 Tax=Mycobacteroides abscessus TaxID=36809 RepID=UPI000928D677|nr:hypothetical protein [Mycobacteroides abscessus]SHX65910.1 Uncharacterised protein [Mycobacteroides abscessus subsp. abscessus]SIC60790.1 Uncharacterised protein [Mycobacteroides abscessus subsp. abscessus]SKK21440.1 Uncharacterised protein [Mycobacteroides abscessus subsp. abscessus]